MLLLGCGPGSVPPTATPYELVLPEGFPAQELPEDNPLTEEGVALGRALYYDSALDGLGFERSCGMCHLQERAFVSDREVGIQGQANLGWSDSFLWTGAIEGTLEDAMAFSVEDVFQTTVGRLGGYDDDFDVAFGPGGASTERAALALAQFLRTVVTGNSTFDQRQRGELEFTPEEGRGFVLFYTESGDCFHCHGGALLTDNRFHNNGLDADVDGTGREEVTGDPLDAGAYKTPTLRNIALTAPYMHDDRFETLEEVVAFYSSGLVDSPTVDPLMKGVEQGGVQLDADDQAALVAFLRTLTDEDFLVDPDFGPP